MNPIATAVLSEHWAYAQILQNVAKGEARALSTFRRRCAHRSMVRLRTPGSSVTQLRAAIQFSASCTYLPTRIFVNRCWGPCPGSRWWYLKVWHWAGWRSCSPPWRIGWWCPHRSTCGRRLESVQYLPDLAAGFLRVLVYLWCIEILVSVRGGEYCPSPRSHRIKAEYSRMSLPRVRFVFFLFFRIQTGKLVPLLVWLRWARSEVLFSFVGKWHRLGYTPGGGVHKRNSR